MKPISFKRHRFPAEVIRHAVWLYFRFNLSLRDVEELLAARGIDVSYATIRCWTIKFGPQIARRLKRLRPSPVVRLRGIVASLGEPKHRCLKEVRFPPIRDIGADRFQVAHPMRAKGLSAQRYPTRRLPRYRNI